MAASYSQELRDRILAAYDRGLKTKEIAELFLVSRAYARRVRQRRDQFGETRPRPRGGARVIKIDLAKLAEAVRTRPDATAKELRAELGIQCAESAIYLALKRLGLSFKKRRCTPASRIAPTSPRNARRGVWSSPRLSRPG